MKKFAGLTLLLVALTVATQSLAPAISKKERIENLTSLIKQVEPSIGSDERHLKFLDSQISELESRIPKTSLDYERIIIPLKKGREESRKILEESIELLREMKEELKKVEALPE